MYMYTLPGLHTVRVHIWSTAYACIYLVNIYVARSNKVYFGCITLFLLNSFKYKDWMQSSIHHQCHTALKLAAVQFTEPCIGNFHVKVICVKFFVCKIFGLSRPSTKTCHRTKQSLEECTWEHLWLSCLLYYYSDSNVLLQPCHKGKHTCWFWLTLLLVMDGFLHLLVFLCSCRRRQGGGKWTSWIWKSTVSPYEVLHKSHNCFAKKCWSNALNCVLLLLLSPCKYISCVKILLLGATTSFFKTPITSQSMYSM